MSKRIITRRLNVNDVCMDYCTYMYISMQYYSYIATQRRRLPLVEKFALKFVSMCSLPINGPYFSCTRRSNIIHIVIHITINYNIIWVPAKVLSVERKRKPYYAWWLNCIILHETCYNARLIDLGNKTSSLFLGRPERTERTDRGMVLYILLLCGVSIDIMIHDSDAVSDIITYIFYIMISLLSSMSYTKPLPSERT